MGMTREELDRAGELWPSIGTSLWNSSRLPWPPKLEFSEAVTEYNRQVAELEAARTRLLALRGRAQYTARGWNIEHLVFIGDARTGLGGCWLCHREPSYWEPSWTRDLSGFEPLDDGAREVLAFVALQIERDPHLGDRAQAPWDILPPPRDTHLRYLREFLARKTEHAPS